MTLSSSSSSSSSTLNSSQVLSTSSTLNSVNPLHSFIPSNPNPHPHPIQSIPFLKKPPPLQLQTSSSSSYPTPHLIREVNANSIQNNFNLLHNSNPSSSAPSHVSLFGFPPQDINLYDCINSQTLPLTAPLPQSIELNKPQIDHLSLPLQDSSSRIHNLHQPHTLQDNDSFELYPPLSSHPAHQGSMNQYAFLLQSTSRSQAPLGIDQPHSSSAISSFTPHPSIPPFLPPLENALALINSIEIHPPSSRPDRLDSNDLGLTSVSLNSLDPSENSLPVLLLDGNSEPKPKNQILLEPLSNAPITPLDQTTPVALSEQSNGSPHLGAQPPNMRYNATTTSTLSLDFRRRKDWIKRLVEDLEDVIQVVTPTGELLFLTETMSRLTGFKTSDLMSSKLYDWCFEEEDTVNLKRELKKCTQRGNQLNLYCRFKKNDSGFVILEMVGHMICIQPNSEKAKGKGYQRAILINGRVHPTSFGQLMDNFLELLIDNEILIKKLLSREQALSQWSEGEAEIDEETQKRKYRRKESRSIANDPTDENDNESEDDHNDDHERLNHPMIGRNCPSKPRKRLKKDKIDFLCLDCGVTQSPEWRKGPMGRKTLCNACGLRYAKKGQVIGHNVMADKN